MYIVTGATGHIGNNAVRYLLDQKLPVRVLVRKIDQSLEGLDIDIKVSSSFDESFLDSCINFSDTVIHAAGYINLFNDAKMDTFRTNLQLTKRITQICLRKQCKLIYISSVDIIQKSKKGLIAEPTDFQSIAFKKSYYQMSKWLATQYVDQAFKKGLNGVILYPSAVIGPYDFKPSQVGKEIKHMLSHRLLFSIRGGYNFVDVRDVSKAIYLSSFLKTNEHIIISGYHQTIHQLYENIELISKLKKTILTIPIWLAYISVLFYRKYSVLMIKSLTENDAYDSTKRKVHLFDELIPFESTLSDTIDWFSTSLTNKDKR